MTKSVDTYLQTMYTANESTPMDIGAVSAMSPSTCLCCGKYGHTKQNCKFKDETCRTRGKQGHLASVCRSTASSSSGGKGYQKSKVKGKNKDGKGGDKTCLCCGRKGHVRKDCRFKDEKCQTCGKVGHLKAVCRSREAHQVEELEDTSAEANACWALMVSTSSWALMVSASSAKQIHEGRSEVVHLEDGQRVVYKVLTSAWLVDTSRRARVYDGGVDPVGQAEGCEDRLEALRSQR